MGTSELGAPLLSLFNMKQGSKLKFYPGSPIFLSYQETLRIESSTSLGSLQKFEGAAGEFKGALGTPNFEPCELFSHGSSCLPPRGYTVTELNCGFVSKIEISEKLSYCSSGHMFKDT